VSFLFRRPPENRSLNSVRCSVVTEVPKRGRGRPKGSRNKPKAPPLQDARSSSLLGHIVEIEAPAVASRAGGVPVSGASCSGGEPLLERYQRTARSLESALERETDTKIVASLSTTLNRTYWHIGQLTGEAQLTEAKIVRSEAWRNMLTRIEQVLGKHPEAAAELAEYFESLETT
jgi:hypothetical protein